MPIPSYIRLPRPLEQSCNSSTTPLTGSTHARLDVTKGKTRCRAWEILRIAVARPRAPTASRKHASPQLRHGRRQPDTTWETGPGLRKRNHLATQWPLAVGTFHSTTTSITLKRDIPRVKSPTVPLSRQKVTVTSTSSGHTYRRCRPHRAHNAQRAASVTTRLSGGTVTRHWRHPSRWQLQPERSLRRRHHLCFKHLYISLSGTCQLVR